MIGTTAALLGSAAIGAGGNIFSGIFGAKKANSAAKIQAEAARQAALKVRQATESVNPAILEAATNAGGSVVRTAADAAAGVNSAADRANALLDPYSAAGADASGALRAGLVPGGDFNKAPTLADLQIDPGYDFRLKEGQKAIERSAAARGGATGGGVLKALTNYGQEAGSQEFQKAFERFRVSTQDRFGNLLNVSEAGRSASGTQGNNLIGAGKYAGDITTGASEFAGSADINARNRTSDNTIRAAEAEGDYLTQGANARAAGKIGGANALTGAIGGGINSVTGAIQLSELLKNPAGRVNYFSRFRRPNYLTDTTGGFD